MKRKRNKNNEDNNNSTKKSRKESEIQTNSLSNNNNSSQDTTELLKLAFERVCALQAELERESEEEIDGETAGYAACAVETFRFLAAEGLSADHPIVKQLSKHLMGDKS